MNSYKQNLTVSTRIDYIDIFRSIGIILMVMGHVDFGRYFDFFIHSFHMPMFFLISGMFFQISKFSVRKKIKTLL